MAPPQTTRQWLRTLSPHREDLRVWLSDRYFRRAGYCWALADSGRIDDPRGAYRHWRCERRRRHCGPHRAINYTWTATTCAYDPINSGADRQAAVTAGTVDVEPLPTPHVVDRYNRSTYSQRLHYALSARRVEARRGRARPGPVQLGALLRHIRAVFGALDEADWLERAVTRHLDAGALPLEHDEVQHLKLVTRKLRDHLTRVG
jgi:hypothetical protein